MDLDAVKSVRGLRVERAGSEQQRRRRQEQPSQEFADALEHSLHDEAASDLGHGRDREPHPHTAQHLPQATPPMPHPTPRAEAQPPLVKDFVSISLKGQVSSEVYNARGSAMKVSLAQLLALGLHDQMLPALDRGADEAGTNEAAPEPENNGGVDTVA